MPLSADSLTRRIGLVLCLLVSLAPMRISAQERVGTAEFAARRARLLAGIPDGIAVILGGEEHPADRALHGQHEADAGG
jgi:hypothetical protein